MSIFTSRKQGRWSSFIETTRFGGFKFRLAAENLGDDKQQRNRFVFDGNRSNNLVRHEHSKRTENVKFSFTISRAL